MKNARRVTVGVLILMVAAFASAQQASKHVLSSDEVKKTTPAEYFFRGQKAPVQLRNAVGFQLADGKMMIAALVDGSGFPSDGKVGVMDVGNNDVLSEASQTDPALQHAVPLKLVEDGAGYKLYAGKKSIQIKVE